MGVTYIQAYRAANDNRLDSLEVSLWKMRYVKGLLYSRLAFRAKGMSFGEHADLKKSLYKTLDLERELLEELPSRPS